MLTRYWNLTFDRIHERAIIVDREKKERKEKSHLNAQLEEMEWTETRGIIAPATNTFAQYFFLFHSDSSTQNMYTNMNSMYTANDKNSVFRCIERAFKI